MKAKGKNDGMTELVSYLKKYGVNLTLRGDTISDNRIVLRFEKGLFQNNYIIDTEVIEKENASFGQILLQCSKNFVEEIKKAENDAISVDKGGD